MKKEVVKDAAVEQAYGKKLTEHEGYTGKDSKLVFSFEFDAFENAEEVRKAGEWPKDSDIVSMVNAKLKAAARAKATTEALDKVGIKKPDINDPAVRRARMIADFVAQGATEDFATQTVDAMLAAIKGNAPATT